MDGVAACCGLGSAALLRHHFRQVVGVSPADYRSTFRLGARDEDAGSVPA